MASTSRVALLAAMLLLISPAAVPRSSSTVAAAEGAPVWSTPTTLDAASGAPDAAVNGRGEVVVVWALRARGSSAIRTAYRPAGGEWEPAVTIGYGAEPQVGIDHEGNITAVWSTYRQGWTDGVRAARRPAGRAWRAPVQLSRDVRAEGYKHPADWMLHEDLGAGRPLLAVSAGGTVAVTWHWRARLRHYFGMQSATRPSGSRWQRPETLPRHDGHRVNQGLGIDRRGHATSLHITYDRPHFTVVVRRYGPHHGWRAARRLWRVENTADWYEDQGTSQLAVNARGDALAAFGPNRFAVRPAGQSWSRDRRIQTVPRDNVAPGSLVIDGAGTATLLRDGNAVTRRPLYGPWRPLTRVSDMPPGWPTMLAINRAGDLVLTTLDDDEDIKASYRQVGHGWSDATTVGPGTYSGASPAVRRDGGAVVAWVSPGDEILVRELAPGG